MTTKPLWNKADIVTSFDIMKKIEGASNSWSYRAKYLIILSAYLTHALIKGDPGVSNQASIYFFDNLFN